MGKVTMTELIGRTYGSYETEIREYESKRNGDPEIDRLIDKTVAPLKEKLETLEIMFEIETGKPMFVD